MKTLTEIQDGYAKELGFFNWEDLLRNMLAERQIIPADIDGVAKRYAQQACEDLRERIAENARVIEAPRFTVLNGALHRYSEKRVDKDSILETEIILP